MKYKLDYMEALWFILIALMMLLVLAKAATAQTCMKCPTCPRGMACAQGCFEVPCGGGGVSAHMRQRADETATNGATLRPPGYGTLEARFSRQRQAIREMLKNMLFG